MKRRKTLWRIVAKALGEKAGKSNAEADQIAFLRLLITVQILITNFFIIFGVTRTHILPMKPSTKQQIESLAKELNATVQYNTVLSKTQTASQIILTYDQQRRQNSGDDTQ